jgi:hypothetical protein
MDGGGEYESSKLKAYLVEKGIHHEKTNADTPPENGVAKRINCTIQEMARCLLHDAGLPDSFWSYTVLHCSHILNLLPSHSIHEKTTPLELFTGNKPSLTHLRILGCKAYAHIPKEKCDKFATTSMECIYIGYTENYKAYCLYHKHSRRVFES